MQTLQARDIAFSYSGTSVPLFSQINFSLSPEIPNMMQAIVGRNGVGKSLFLRILAGEVLPTSGEVITNILPEKIGYLAQHADLGDCTLADVIGLTKLRNAYQAVCDGSANDAEFELLDGKWDFEHQALRVLAQVKLSADLLGVQCNNLSGGQQTKARLALLLMRDCTLLLLDEPSNHLDDGMRRWLSVFLQNFSGQSIVVTHDTCLLKVAHSVSELTPHAMQASAGGWDDYQASRAIQLDTLDKKVIQHKSELRQAKLKQQSDRERHDRAQNKAQKSRVNANQTKSSLDFQTGRSDKTTTRLTALHNQRISAEQAALEQVQKAIEHISPLVMRPSRPKKINSPALQVSNVILPYGTKHHINLMLNVGERVALCGENGSGKSTLLRVLMGTIFANDGDIHISKSVMLLDQHLSLLHKHESAVANFQRLSPSTWQESDYRTVLAQLRIRGDKALLPVSALSGGEQLKVALACVFLGEISPALLLLDEPNNHLDLESKNLLAHTIADYKGAVVMVSHDENFVTACAITQKLVIQL